MRFLWSMINNSSILSEAQSRPDKRPSMNANMWPGKRHAKQRKLGYDGYDSNFNRFQAPPGSCPEGSCSQLAGSAETQGTSETSGAPTKLRAAVPVSTSSKQKTGAILGQGSLPMKFLQKLI